MVRNSHLVADFFCGCGTTISVAQKLNRRWIGVDISHLAIGLIERRLIRDYGMKIKNTYAIDGLPKDIDSARLLAQGIIGGRLKFQDWIIETMIGGIHNPKKTADGGWDGHLTFEGRNKKEIALIEVKSGNATISQLRAFITVIKQQKASLGVFVCFEDQITKGMQLEAKNEGYLDKEALTTKCDKIQLLSVEDLMEGKNIQLPQVQRTTLKTDQSDKQELLL
jgi:site-specific DNA-methyltransferase (adenine-specific)